MLVSAIDKCVSTARICASRVLTHCWSAEVIQRPSHSEITRVEMFDGFFVRPIGNFNSCNDGGKNESLIKNVCHQIHEFVSNLVKRGTTFFSISTVFAEFENV